MKNLFYFKKLFIAVSVGLFSSTLYSAPSGQEDPLEATQRPTKKQKIQDWNVEKTAEHLIVTNPQGEQITYKYESAPDKKTCIITPLETIPGKFRCDPTDKWICIIVDYSWSRAIQDNIPKGWEFVLFNPKENIYIILDELPEIRNDLLFIDPLTYIPQISDPQKYTDWVIQRGSQPGKVIGFLTDELGNELIDADKRACLTRKVGNKTSDQIIYSLHAMGNENATCINISGYLNRDYGVVVDKVDTCARFLNLDEGQFVLIYVTDKLTGEKSPFMIELKDIRNKASHKLPFKRGDFYSRTAPMIDDKWIQNWKIILHQDLLNNDGVPIIDPQGNKFYFHKIQRKSKNDELIPILVLLNVVESNGKESGINLGYYLWRDFDHIPKDNLEKVKISDNGQFLRFAVDGQHYAIGINDIKDLKKGSLYAPIIELDSLVNRDAGYFYRDFISFNPGRCVWEENINEDTKKRHC